MVFEFILAINWDLKTNVLSCVEEEQKIQEEHSNSQTEKNPDNTMA